MDHLSGLLTPLDGTRPFQDIQMFKPGAPLPTAQDELFAYADPPTGGYDADTWVDIGVGLGVSRAPSEPGAYYLVVEPLLPEFRRGESWRLPLQYEPDEYVRFGVGGGVFLDERYELVRHPIVVSPHSPSSAGTKSEGGLEADRRRIAVEVVQSNAADHLNAYIRLEWPGEPIDDRSLYLPWVETREGNNRVFRRVVGIRRPGSMPFTQAELDPDNPLLDLVEFVVDPGEGSLRVFLDDLQEPVLSQSVVFPVIEFMDDAPTYSRTTDPGSPEYDPAVLDSDNYFLRENLDHTDLDIYYRVLPESLVPAAVSFRFLREDTDQAVGAAALSGEVNGDGSFKTGEPLHVRWQGADDGTGAPREIGYYRVQMVVRYEGLDEEIVTPIEDGDELALGWQCPQAGLAIQDLVWKHRPRVHVHWNEIGVPTNRTEFESLSGNHVHRWEGEERLLSQPISPIPYGVAGSDTFWDLFNDGVWTSTDLGDPDHASGYATNNGAETLLHSSKSNHGSTLDPPGRSVLFLQYWMFANFSTMGFNVLPYGLFEYPVVWHEGDLEHVQVALMVDQPLDPTLKKSWFKPLAVTASQHYYAQTLRWDTTNGDSPGSVGLAVWEQDHVEHTDNERPSVYLALGSHATYLAAAPYISMAGALDLTLGTEAQYEPITDPDSDAFDTTCLPAAGSLVACASIDALRLEDEYTLLPLSSDSEFSSYFGLWGFQPDEILLPGNDGPPGPPLRAAKRGLLEDPVILLDRPCELHNGAVRSGSEFDSLRLTCTE